MGGAVGLQGGIVSDPRHKQRVAYAKDTTARIKNKNQATEIISDHLTDAYERQVLAPLKKRIADWSARVMNAHARR